MKKVLFAISAFALLMGAASCQDEFGLDKVDNTTTESSVANPLNTITVKMGSATRLGLDVLTPVFEEGDEVFGWDATDNYTYQCTAVSGSEATFTRTSTYAPSREEGTVVNLVYANGYDAEDIVDGVLSIDISSQNATSFDELPIVMASAGTVDSDGICEMVFSNETSVIKVVDCVTAEAEGVKFASIEAENLFPQMTVSLDGNGIISKAIGTTPGTITNKGGFTAGADGKISTFIATFPTQGSATDVNFKVKTTKDDNDRYYRLEGGSKTVKPNTILNLGGKTFDACEVARITETSTTYASLADAFAAAGTTPATIVLLDNVVSDKIETTAGSDITFDLNGKTVEVYFSDYGKLTIEDNSAEQTGVLKTSSGYGQAFYVRADSELVIDGGTIMSLPSNSALFNCQKNSLTTINGGKFIGSHFVLHFTTNTAKAVINGGYFEGAEGIFELSYAGVLTINDGYFNGPELFGGDKKTTNTVTCGGYYTVEPNFTSTGYAPKALASTLTVDGVDYTYTVAEYNAKMSVGGVDYDSVADAVDAINDASSDVSVKFLQNISLDQEIVINNANAKVTLDLNGKTVRANNASATSALVVTGASTIVDIIDSVGDGSFDHSYSNTGYTVTVNGGTLNLISGSINNNTSTGYGRWAVKVAATDAPATFNMSGGEIHGGRAISIGGGSADYLSKVNISGGLVEGRNTVNTSGDYYTAIGFENSYGDLVITGGTIVGKARAVIYSSVANTSITIKEGDNGTIPCLYGTGTYILSNLSSQKGCFKSPFKFYCNKKSGDGFYQTGLSTNNVLLDEPHVDDYGNSFAYLLQNK